MSNKIIMYSKIKNKLCIFESKVIIYYKLKINQLLFLYIYDLQHVLQFRNN